MSVIQTATEAYVNRLANISVQTALGPTALFLSGGYRLDEEPIQAVREAITATEADEAITVNQRLMLAKPLAVAVSSYRLVRNAMAGRLPTGKSDLDQVVTTMTTDEIVSTLTARIAPATWDAVIAERRLGSAADRAAALDAAEREIDGEELAQALERAWLALRDSAKAGVEGAITFAHREKQAEALLRSINLALRPKIEPSQRDFWNDALLVFVFAGMAVLVADWSYWEARIVYAAVGKAIPADEVGLPMMEGIKPLSGDQVGTIAGVTASAKSGGGCALILPLAALQVLASSLLRSLER